MTAARANALVARVRAACGYRRPVRVPASMQEVLELAEILRDLAQLVEDGAPNPVCAWCPEPARGNARHNDGRRRPSCGATDHGQEFA